jgi:hypothetical protein
MDSAKNQLIEKLQSANNILVTVSRNPSVDQLAACIGLTLLLNKLKKHATAVFSGTVPSTIEFLQPEDTLEKNTDSLRDFIIALDKSKADKLRYKVEDEMVRIFITPYRTSISQADLEFSQGDFNVDLVVALGVSRQEDLDEAIVAHGRILHDATVSTITVAAGEQTGLGSINWSDPQASSLSELVADLARALGQNLLDGQLATALLTGVVAETQRFSNEKTTSQTMSVSAELMAAGANQQLVATKLDEGGVQPKAPDQSNDSSGGAAGQPAVPDLSPSPKSDNGTLEINHPSDANQPIDPLPLVADQPPQNTDTSATSALSKTELKIQPLQGTAPADAPHDEGQPAPMEGSALPKNPKLIIEPPQLGGVLTANSRPENDQESPNDPLSLPAVEDNQLLMTHGVTPPAAAPEPSASPVATAPSLAGNDQSNHETLTELEASVNSPHLAAATELDSARDEVLKALNSNEAPSAPAPIEALNAQPLGAELHALDSPLVAGQPVAGQSTPSFAEALQQAIPPVPVDLPGAASQQFMTPDLGQTISPTLPPAPMPPADQPSPMSHSFDQPQPFVAPTDTTAPIVVDPNAPPPVPPPIPFRFGNGAEPPTSG